MYTAAVVTTAKNGSKPSVHQWMMDKCGGWGRVSAYRGMLFRLEEKGGLTPAAMWTDLEDIVLNGISQARKDEYRMIPLTRGPRGAKSVDTEGGMVGISAWRRGREELSFNRDRVFVLQDEEF